MRHLVVLLCALALAPASRAVTWNARWISVPGDSPFDYGVYHFRRSFDLPAKPASFVIHVTGDNRYELFVNGEQVCEGPARGDLYHWRYETVDIASHLRPGRNILAAVVWNFAQYAPEAQVTNQTGFLLQGDTPAEHVVNTGRLWKCIRDDAYRPLTVNLHAYYAAGPGDEVDGSRYPWGWEQLQFDDSTWKQAQEGPSGSSRDARDAPSRWMLVPRSIPPMEQKPQRIVRVRRSEGVKVPEGFPERSGRIEVPAHTNASLLLDQTYETTGYPELVVSRGAGATITLGYAEALFLPSGRNNKGNRNEVAGKQFIGYKDVFLPDGGANRLFRPLWWRTWRYLKLNIETKDQPLVIEDLRGVFSAYPFRRRARFDADVPGLQKILDVGWRTARLCAHDTYMDCPYYEQLQYAGDTRIQALVSLYMSGDGRLMRKAIALLNSSRTAEGATYSRAPSRLQQYIPPFSLWWIGMVHDYWMYQDDPAFVRQMLPGVHAVLSFFAAHQERNGGLGVMPWWNFVDWTSQWRGGVPPSASSGGSAPLDLQLLLAYRWAAQMESALGSPALADQYRRSESELRASARSLYWDSGRRLFADNPAHTEFSQHSNALAVLADLIQGSEAHDLIERVAADKSLVQCSIYFRYYLHSAMDKAGAGGRYLDMLGPWRTMLSRGLTTWAEQEDPTRSDCHAWGASPNIELFRTVLGIDSATPGFRRVLIRPNPGKLTHVSGTIPHPKGEITVDLTLRNGSLKAEVALPPGTPGEFIWKGTSRALHPGRNSLSF